MTLDLGLFAGLRPTDEVRDRNRINGGGVMAGIDFDETRCRFEVRPGIYQIRGLDSANMTLIEGDRGDSATPTLLEAAGMMTTSPAFTRASRLIVP